jgi:carboxypeptidase Q
VEQAKDMIRLLEPLGPMEIEVGHSGADVGPMRPSGVVLMGHQVDGSTYFNFHHSAADTIDKVDPVELSKNVAAMAVMAFVIADMPERMGKPAGEESAGSK